MAQRAPFVSGWIPRLQAQGLSANAALEYLKSQGLGVRRQTFLRAWGELRAAADRSPLVASARRDRRPTPEEVTLRVTKGATGIIFDAVGTVENQRTGEVYTTPISAKFDELVSYNKALSEMLGTLEDASDPGGTLDGFRVLSVDPVAVREQIPGEWEPDDILL